MRNIAITFFMIMRTIYFLLFCIIRIVYYCPILFSNSIVENSILHSEFQFLQSFFKNSLRKFSLRLSIFPYITQKTSVDTLLRFSNWATRIRTLRWRSQSPLPYRLAIAQCWLLLIVYMIILYLASYFFKFFY